MEDLPSLSLRELLTLARERLGPAASGLKTKAELLAALAPPGSTPKPAAPVPVVTSDFFRRRNG